MKNYWLYRKERNEEEVVNEMLENLELEIKTESYSDGFCQNVYCEQKESEQYYVCEEMFVNGNICSSTCLDYQGVGDLTINNIPSCNSTATFSQDNVIVDTNDRITYGDAATLNDLTSDLVIDIEEIKYTREINLGYFVFKDAGQLGFDLFFNGTRIGRFNYADEESLFNWLKTKFEGIQPSWQKSLGLNFDETELGCLSENNLYKSKHKIELNDWPTGY